MALDVHVVSHTHWDREWYHPAERFRQKLVALVDELLDRPATENNSFLLDGQAIVIEDYLAVRPDRAELVGRLIRSGQIEAGPWYVLADELIPSGEALVRNLLAGLRVLRQLNASAPPVLYCPDSFGHPAALPAIAAGFDLPLIILWRGYGGRRAPVGDTVHWIAPSGESAVLFHLPRDGYEFGSHLPTDDADSAARWARMRAELLPRSTTGVMLIQNGADHHAPQIGQREAIDALERSGKADSVHRSSLARFATALVERAKTSRLAVVHGELRDSYGYTWTIQGTFGTRAHEKRANAHAERVLLREAEPWSALASFVARTGGSAQDGQVPKTARSRRPLIEAAWRTLLKAHPHDTLCGCSIDEVAEAMELRLRSAANQARGVIEDSLMELLGHDAATARTQRDRWQPIVVVRNAAPRARGGVAIVDVEEFLADVAVGPGSAPGGGSAPIARRSAPNVPSLGAVQVLSRSLAYSRTESPRHYPDNDLVSVSRVAAWIADVPPYGIASHAIGGASRTKRASPPAVVVTARGMENGVLSVKVNSAGVVMLSAPRQSRVVESLFEFVDESDVGDLYTPAPRPRPFTVAFRGVRRLHRGPLRGELVLAYRLDATSGRRSRIADLHVHLVLDANADVLRVHITGTNRANDHRLRVVFRTDVAKGDVWADAAFGAVRREPIVVEAADAAVEHAPPTAPLHRYVSQFTHSAGATMFSDGLAEYEAMDGGALAVTLVRAAGQLSRNDLPERPGHAGWPAPTPLAQCLGPFAADFALLLHGPRDAATINRIERTADDVVNPLTGGTLRSALRVPADVHGVELVGVGLAFSAVKESEDGESLVLRCVNLGDDHVDGEWRLPFAARAALLARLDESVVSVLESTGGAIRFLAPPRAIVTILVRV